MDIENYFEVGRMGVEHALLPEKGPVVPGDVVIGPTRIPAHTALSELFPPA